MEMSEALKDDFDKRIKKGKKGKTIDLGRPYKIRMAVTSHSRDSLYGPIIISRIRFPGPICGLFKIWKNCITHYIHILKFTSVSSQINREMQEYLKNSPF